MRRVVAVILPLLILGAAPFAHGQSASADSESGASDFLKALNAAAEPESDSESEPEPESEPESPALKSAAADDREEDAVAESDVTPKPVVSDKPPREQQAFRKKVFLCTAVGLDVLGAGLVAYGVYENSKVAKTESKNGREYLKISPDEAKKAATRRNMAYTFGSVLLASGITVHILF
jgi:hypothetical protein